MKDKSPQVQNKLQVGKWNEIHCNHQGDRAKYCRPEEQLEKNTSYFQRNQLHREMFHTKNGKLRTV